MPVSFKDNRLTWVDLDLDYRLHLDHRIERLDENEFEENAKLMKYSDHLIEQVHAACQEVEEGLARQTFPFDYEHQVERYKRIKKDGGT